MNAANFDSLSYANRLKAAGMDAGLAEVQASAMTEVIQGQSQNLSTKPELQQLGQDLHKDMQSLRVELQKDMQSLRVELQKDMQSVRVDFQKDMQLLEQRMVIKLGSLMVLAIGVVATLVKLL
jgi:hypothetical protein